ncbi:ComEC family competence protein, partial [Patescibacteria group bacterium]|nr:ComEC family competence protein [Patescibacteria group bacterium]
MEGVNKIVNSKSRTFLALCFSFISGIGVFSFSDNTHLAFYLYISIFAVLFFLSFYWNDKIIKFALFCCLFFIFGGLRYFFSIPGDSPKHIRYFNGENKEIVGWASQEPERKIGQTKYVLTVIPREAGKSLSGKVLVSLPNYPEYQYGDEMVLSCLLQPPKDTVDSTFIYSKYLARDGIYSICSNPKIKSVRINARGNFFKKKLLSLKKRTGEQVERLWPEPESSLMAGLLYGARASLPQNLLDNFSRVGITHIIAISGFNISIIASILMISLIYSGLARPRAFWIAVSGIVLFVLFTGASASVVRAGIMGVIVLLAAQLGRLSRIGNV